MALKKIQYDVRLLSTEKMLQGKTPIVYTNDLNSAEFVFNILEMTPEQLAGATATTLLYMRDGSFFQNSDVNLDGTTFSYLLKENEGNHIGLAKIQLVVKIGTAEYASQLYSFEVVNGLETKVASAAEVMIQDWTTLTRDAQAYIDHFNLNETTRQQQFDDAQMARTNIFTQSETYRTMAFEAAEALRQQKETERIEAEQSRTEAEGTRQTTFTTNEANRTETFNANEATRQEKESIRQQTETQRATAESVRVANEAERISKDSKRDSKIDSKADVSELKLYAKKSQEEWISPTLLNGVTNYAGGIAPVRYYKNEFNIVCLDGLSSPVATETIIFTLPVEYRPSKKVLVPTVVGNRFGWIRIDSDGSVKLGNGSASAVYISYGGISFRAEE